MNIRHDTLSTPTPVAERRLETRRGWLGRTLQRVGLAVPQEQSGEVEPYDRLCTTISEALEATSSLRSGRLEYPKGLYPGESATFLFKATPQEQEMVERVKERLDWPGHTTYPVRAQDVEQISFGTMFQGLAIFAQVSEQGQSTIVPIHFTREDMVIKMTDGLVGLVEGAAMRVRNELVNEYNRTHLF